jgi:hypothetical protein
MKIQQILETTTSGSVASVSQPMMKQTRESVEVSGLNPVKQVTKGKAKKKGPYANSISEGKVKELTMDLKELTDEEFKKKYSKTKAEVKASIKTEVNEQEIAEQDLIVMPGGKRLRTGFIPHDPDRAEHEGQTLKNSLHTIIRVATHLNDRLSTRDNFPEWVSEKIGAVKSNMVTVMDYLISSQEMQHDPDAMAEGEKNTSYMNKQNQDFYNKNPNFKRDDREVKFVGNQLASKVMPTNKPGQVAKKPITSFKTKGVAEGAAPWAANWKKAALASKKAQQSRSGANHKRAAELHRQGAKDPWGPYKDKHIEAAEKHEKAMKMYEGVAEGENLLKNQPPKSKFYVTGEDGKTRLIHCQTKYDARVAFERRYPDVKITNIRQKGEPKQGVAEGATNDYFKRRKDEEDRIAGTKPPAKRTPKQTDYEKKRKQQDVSESKSIDQAWTMAKNKVNEGAKVDRMVKHVKKSEKKLGHSAEEAENIAWATANKRGMLDNKNKKK